MAENSLAQPARIDQKSEDRKKAELYARCLLGACAGCGTSGFDADLSPVEEGDLTYFAGDELCPECR